MLTKIKNIFIVLLLVLIISQFLRPEKNEASYDSIANFEDLAEVTPEVKTILQNNCYDCHSNITRYPLHMEVSPVSHYMAYHIKEGKEHFNVSNWESYSVQQKDHKLDKFIKELEEKEMPLKPYTWINGELSRADADKLIAWAKATRIKIRQPKDSLPVQQIDTVAVDSTMISMAQ
ncbi:heme-binding domain-containing protein [Aquimarina sp. U1-2]|uniref:heme-binding domain-containing protein n=1 Tax=Aquimarina sp. U1-2 TaxID=2823141 RepID=UPI001AECA59D|nr:heme-binding domain-containing protein [Aquimarina sp. U1-2]MBP2833992.1 heme-binding domain-containing protein [Aquimarina sp. U1-2]